MVTKITGNPLTGLSPIPKGRVIAVKIDNTSAGRPQTNIDAADIVYVEQVEGGLTRLVAVYASQLPSVVGPVRSVRLGDPLLLAPYGGVALAYSGGASGVVASVRQTHIVDASQPVHGGAYSRSGSKPAPYNLMVNLASLEGVLRNGARVRDVGFRWAREARGLASAPPVHGFTAPVGNTAVSFRWDPGRRRWDRQIDGQTVRHRAGVQDRLRSARRRRGRQPVGRHAAGRLRQGADLPRRPDGARPLGPGQPACADALRDRLGQGHAVASRRRLGPALTTWRTGENQLN
jgi:hypothetical protein